uniref:Pentacotripeptide-repeat region of PRORP domain-containing protein n=1 Tax=Salix viminalis TaxID=40686 RepID=A0A6N2MLF0_SALVM
MAVVLARGSKLDELWQFLKEMAQREHENCIGLVSVSTITCLINVLVEEGLVHQALALFYRMKQYHIKPDVYTYGLQTGCRKAIRRRIWEANRLFKIMLFKGFVPDVVTYNCLINGCCKTNKIERALELFEEMINKRGCVPNRVTYNSFISVVNEIDKAVEMLRKMQNINHGLATTSSCTPIIHSLCEAGRVPGARDFLVELVDGGLIPREYTCRLVCDALKSKREGSSLGGEFDKRIKDGIEDRYREACTNNGLPQ